MLNKVNRDKFKGFVIGTVVTSIVTTSLFSFANMQNIEAFFNDIKIQINGKNIDTGNDKSFLYNGRTYIPARYVAEGLGASVKWNETSNTVEIDSVSNEVYNRKEVVDTNSNIIPPSPSPTPINTNQQSSFVFRKVNWGMSKEDVVHSENIQPSFDSKNILAYKTKLGTLDGELVYYFNDKNQLSTILFTSDEKHTNKNDYIDDYKQIKKLFISKYGQPDLDQPVWKNSLFKNNPENYGLAIGIGDLVYGTHWKMEGMEVNLLLNGDNYEIKFNIRLMSTKYEQFKTNDGI